MIDEKVFLGYPIDFQGICKIYPPTVNEVIGNENFGPYHALLTITQEQLDDIYAPEEQNTFQVPLNPMDRQPTSFMRQQHIPTPFEYLMINYHQSEEIQKILHEGFMKIVHEPITVVPEIKLLLIGKSEDELDPDIDLENPRIITEDNYFNFQNTLRIAIGDKPVEPYDVNEDPRIRRIKALGRLRQKRSAEANKHKAPTLGTYLAAICCMGIGLTPLNIGEMSYANVSWLIGMYQQNEEYDIDIRALLAGADSKKVKPKYWIKNLD